MRLSKVTFIHSASLDGDFFHKQEMLGYFKGRLDEFPEGFPRTIAAWVIQFLENTGEIVDDTFCAAMLEIGGTDKEISCVFAPELGTL